MQSSVLAELLTLTVMDATVRISAYIVSPSRAPNPQKPYRKIRLFSWVVFLRNDAVVPFKLAFRYDAGQTNFTMSIYVIPLARNPSRYI